jgi:hypothetical protein
MLRWELSSSWLTHFAFWCRVTKWTQVNKLDRKRKGSLCNINHGVLFAILFNHLWAYIVWCVGELTLRNCLISRVGKRLIQLQILYSVEWDEDHEWWAVRNTRLGSRDLHAVLSSCSHAVLVHRPWWCRRCSPRIVDWLFNELYDDVS